MSKPVYRLKPSKNHNFSGHQLKRDRRVRFTLNGHEFRAYQGDTILTALLAAGVFTAGRSDGSDLGLDAALQLCVKPAGSPDDVSMALPIDRTLAKQGLSLEIFGAPPVRFKGYFGGRDISSLKLDFDKYRCAPGPLHDAPVTSKVKANLLIIGGGIAGMAAAVSAAEAGKNAMLIERRGYLGGDAELFGYAEGEEDPREIVERLKQKIAASDRITVFTHAEALSLSERKVLVHRISYEDDIPRPFLMRVAARIIILATGCADQFPLFPGNRLPRIVPMTEAFHLARAYGLWCGAHSAIFTNTNIAYRLAGQVQNADLSFIGIYDARADRTSRFIDIAKAGGQKIVNGARVQSAAIAQRSDQLYLKMEPSHKGLPTPSEISVDQLLVNDGWRARLKLWQQAGGEVRVDGSVGSKGALDNIALAGSCAGLKGHSGVLQSAMAAVGRLMLKEDIDVADPQIDAHFETPEGPQSISSALSMPDLSPAYASWSGSLITIKPPKRISFLGRILFGQKISISNGIADRALSFSDVLAMTRMDLLPVKLLGRVLSERAVSPHVFQGGQKRNNHRFLTSKPTSEVPGYILSRFGRDAMRWAYAVESGTPLQTGVLLFPNTDVSDPFMAVGVITNEGKSALVKAGSAGVNSVLVARVGAQTSTIRITSGADI